jgi:hypothetical protein
MSYTMMLRSGLLLFLIGYPFCLNRYIISAIFFVIRCALVTRKKFYFFLSAVGRRIEWATVLFSWVVYMHIRMESAATGIIFDCVKHERLCVTMDRFFRLRICLISFKYIYLLVEEPWVIYSDTIVYGTVQPAPMGYTDDLFFCCCGIPSSKAWRKDCTLLGTTSIVV